ncbi:MAG: RNA-binding domain-containing protein [Candidatus Zhuqueibacterota bacterium]
MLTEIEILRMIENGENSFVEFKDDRIANRDLAEEVIALSNHKGGYLFLGVSDDKQIVGLTREDNEERIMNICDDLVFPTVFPTYYETNIGETKIAIIELEVGSNKPYCIPKGAEKKFNPDEIYIRQGSKSRKLKSRDELQRLFQASAHIHYEIIPVAYASMENFDLDFATDFLNKNIRQVSIASGNPETALKNLDLLVETEKGLQPTIAGLLLFGKGEIKKFLPQVGITSIKINGQSKTDQKIDHKFFNENLFANFNNAWNFFKIHNAKTYRIDGKNRIDKFDYPDKVFREILANACIHRDYTIAGSEIMVWIFEDRIEISSPGRLPNTISIEKMKSGAKYHRNPILAQFFAYYGIVEMLGQGVLMANLWLKENGNPELQIEENEEEVVVTIFN